MAKKNKAAEVVEPVEVDAAAADAETVEGEAPAGPKRSKLKLLAIGGVALAACLGGGGYFAAPMALAMLAPAGGPTATADVKAGAETGSSGHEAKAEGAHGPNTVALPPALPVAQLVMPNAAASDYQIVSIYDGEAFLATGNAVIRVKVGSTAPGLGNILAIEASASGGVVTGTLATLKTS